MKKILLLFLAVVPSTCLVAMEEETAASSQAGQEQEIIQTSKLVDLPAEIQLNIIEQGIEDIKDLKSLEVVLKDIASLKKTSRQFRDLLDYQDPETGSSVHKNILKNKLVDQIKKYKIPVDLSTAAQLQSPLLAELLQSPLLAELPELLINEQLFTAINIGDFDEVNSLLKKGANVNAQDDEGNTPLHLAIEHSVDAFIIVQLIYAGANLYIKNKEGKTPLDIATTEQREIIERLSKGIEQEMQQEQSARN